MEQEMELLDDEEQDLSKHDKKKKDKEKHELDKKDKKRLFKKSSNVEKKDPYQQLKQPVAMGHTNPSSVAVVSSKVEPVNLPVAPKQSTQTPQRQPAQPVKIPVPVQTQQTPLKNVSLPPENAYFGQTFVPVVQSPSVTGVQTPASLYLVTGPNQVQVQQSMLGQGQTLSPPSHPSQQTGINHQIPIQQPGIVVVHASSGTPVIPQPVIPQLPAGTSFASPVTSSYPSADVQQQPPCSPPSTQVSFQAPWSPQPPPVTENWSVKSQPQDGNWAPFSLDEKAWVDTEQKKGTDVQQTTNEHLSDKVINSSDETDDEQCHTSSSEESSKDDGEMGRINHVSSWAEDSNSSVGEESVDDGDTNPWLITYEQRGYYLKQFKILQPLDNGVIKGPKARDFFMKSGLPKDILSSIWKMSDLNKDNALNLQEFCIAMHLVVAVRHGVDLPETLPPVMLPHEYQDSTQVDPFSMPVQKTQRISPEPERAEGSCKSPEHWAIFTQNIQDGHGKVQAQAEGLRKNEMVSDLSHEQVNTSRTYERSFSDPSVSDDSSRNQQDSSIPSAVVDQDLESPLSPPPQSRDGVGLPLARPRGKVKTVPNLMDAPPGQLLPPPSGKDIREGKSMQLMPSLKKATSFPSPGSVPSSPPPIDTSVLQSISQESDLALGPSSPPVSPIAKTYAQVTANSQVCSPEVEKSFEDVETIRPKSPLVEKEKEIDEGEKKPESRKNKRTLERPRSFSGDSLYSVHVSSLPSTPSGSTPFINDAKRGPAPPPPPRRKGHSRSSSLDLNKLFGAKSKGSSSSSEKIFTPDSPKIPLPSVLPPTEKVTSIENQTTDSDVTSVHGEGGVDDSVFPGENFADFSKFDSFIAHQFDDGQTKVHRRSLSLDHSHQFSESERPDDTEAASKLQNDETVISIQETGDKPVPKSMQEALPRPVAKKKPPSLPIVALKKPGETETSKEIGERKLKTEPPKVVVKPVTKSLLLHNKIRDLKDKNSALSRLNNELQQELKELMEERVSLEVQLDRLQPFKHNS